MSIKSVKIFFHGDSVSFGQGVSPHLTWVTKISQQISAQFDSEATKLTFSNLGVNGNTTRQGLDRMYYDVLSHSPDVAVVQFGLNDCNYWKTDIGHPRVSPDAFRANLNEMINKLRTFRCSKIILNTNHPTTRDSEKMPYSELTYEQSNIQYNEIIREVARGQLPHGDVVFNDIGKRLTKHSKDSKTPISSFLLPDGLHLSELGHSFYYESIYPSVFDSVKSILDNLAK